MLRPMIVPRGDLENTLTFTASRAAASAEIIKGLTNVAFARIAVMVDDKNAAIQLSIGNGQYSKKVTPFQLQERGYVASVARFEGHPYLLRYDDTGDVYLIEFWFPMGLFAPNPKVEVTPTTAELSYSCEYDLIEMIDDKEYAKGTEKVLVADSVVQRVAVSDIMRMPPKKRSDD